MEHSFNIYLAAEYGERCAILIKHIDFWIAKNKIDGRNLHDGKIWCYFPVKKLKKIFPYLDEQAITYSIGKLDKAGVLLKGNYNKRKFDKTTWYTFTDEFVEKWKEHLEYAMAELPENIEDDLPKGKEPKQRKPKVYAEDSTEFKAAKYFFSLIQKNKPDYKEPNFQQWAKGIDLILNKDKRGKDELRRVMEFVQDDEFWKINILSISTLREKYDRMVMGMNRKAGTSKQQVPDERREATAIDKEVLRLQKEQLNSEGQSSAQSGTGSISGNIHSGQVQG